MSWLLSRGAKIVLASAAIVSCAAPLAAQETTFSAPPPPIVANLGEPPRVGTSRGFVYLRDRRDIIRLYPAGELALDVRGFRGDGTHTLTKAQAGVDLGPRFLVRHAVLSLGGELLRRISFNAAVDFTANPAIEGARARSTSTRIGLEEAWGAFDGGRGLLLMLGVFHAPFSLENTTARSDLSMMERNLAIRSFVVPGGSVLGATLGGSMKQDRAHARIGLVGAERVAPARFDRTFAVMGRLVGRPFYFLGSALRQLTVGASARAGTRNPRDANGDAPALTTGQGFALLAPRFEDGDGSQRRMVLSGRQWAAGGELRLPLRGFALRSELYWVSRETRESALSPPATAILRSGQLSGLGWYVELSTWLLQAFNKIGGDLPAQGNQPGVKHLDLAALEPEAGRNGLELGFLAAGVNATYSAAERTGRADPSQQATRIETYQIGFSLNFWRTQRFRLSFNGNYYRVPHAGSGKNLAFVPGNLGTLAQRHAHANHLWELAARTTLLF